MKKIDTSNIDKSRKISEYEQKYGSGETMTKIFTYHLLKWLIAGIILIIIISAFVITILSQKGNDITTMVTIFSLSFNIIGGGFMAMIGYFIGKKS